jgi:hypothetical protein
MKMSYSSDVSDKELEIIEPLLPQKKKIRPPVWTKRQILKGIFYQLKNGCNYVFIVMISDRQPLINIYESVGSITAIKSLESPSLE